MYIICSVLFYMGYVQAAERPLMILPRHVESCTPKGVQSWDLKNITLLKDAESGQTSISGDMVFSEPFDQATFIHVLIHKCMSEELSSCTYFISLDDRNVCKDMPDPNKMWQTLIKSVKTMPTSCPIPAGSYKLVDVPFTEHFEGKIKCIPGFWRIEVSVRKGSRTLGCVRGYGEIKQKRRSRKKPS